MRNYFFYILFICIFTKSFGKNEDTKESSRKEPVNQKTDFYEQEAKTDIENLLSSNRNFSEEDREPFNVNARSSKLMERIDNSLKNTTNKNKPKTNLRTNAQINGGKSRYVVQKQNLLLNLRNAIESSFNLRNSDAQLLNNIAFPNGSTIKSRISGGHNVNTMLQNAVNYVNIKPEVYPLLYITDAKYGSREIASEKSIVGINNQYYTNDNDKLTKMVNKIDTKHNNGTFIRTSTIPMSENFDLEGLLNKLYMKQEVIPTTRKESATNVMLNDFLNKFNARSTNHLMPGNRVVKVNNQLDELDNIGSNHRDYSKTIVLRSDLVDNVHSNTSERLHEFMKYMDTGKILRTPRNALSDDQRPQPALLGLARHGDHRSRHRRSSGTQAGYTQDPDTCKTYNENLGKLWSNLSKLINITDQPNDRALHNIAMMIQAYLDHQNAKRPPETHKAEHEGHKDKFSEIILRIRKLLDEAEGSAGKITKTIIKYLKPHYKDAERKDCQQVNEEYLTLSVDLLYKNYLEKTDCQGEDDGMIRKKKVSLTKKKRTPGKTDIGRMTLSMANSDLIPHFQNLLTEHELYEDFYKGKTQRMRSPNKNRRIFKPSRQQRSRLVDRSGNQNERENLNTRSKSSSRLTSKKHKKSFLKFDLAKSRCEKYATRSLVVALRTVMERFNGLLECQLDNTLRSVSFSRDSEDPYHRYASKLYSNENSRRDRKVSPRFPVRNTGRKRNESHKKLYTERHGSSFENDQDARARDHYDETDSVWVRKYSFDKTKSENYNAHVEARDTDARVSDNDNNKHHSNNDYDNEYFQSPPSYDNYDGVYKTHQNAFPSLINPINPTISLNDKKNTPSKRVFTPGIAENNYEYEDEMTFYGDSSISAETHDEIFGQETEISTKKSPLLDLTQLRSDDQLIEEKNKIPVKTFESITEFLKRARDESLKTPEFAVPFALDTNKGYVELTHLIKYPKTLVYRPQFLVKNTMPYDDFLKTINDRNMTTDDVTLMKIVRHLSNGSVQILFETEDSEAPLEILNLNDKDTRRSGSPDPVVDYQSQSRLDTANENNNADLTEGNREGFSRIYHNEERRQDFKSPLRSDRSSSDKYLSSDLDLNTDSDALRSNEELSQNSYFSDNSDTNSTPNAESRSSWFRPLPILFANHPSPDFGKQMGSSVAPQIGAGIQQELGTQRGSGTQMGLDTALNLGIKLNPMHPSQLGSFIIKLKPSHSNAQATPNPSLNSQSHMNSHFDSPSGSYSASNSHLNLHSGSWSNPSHSLLPNTDSNNQEVGKNLSSSTQSIAQWWRKWKSGVKGKLKQIVGKMANLAKKFDHIVKP